MTHYSLTKDPFLFFIHIPKTAGSTFLSILMRSFGKRFYGVYSNVNNEYPFTGSQLTEFVHDFGHLYDCLASHRLHSGFPVIVANSPCAGISFIRDPFDVFLSHYFYHRHHVPGFSMARELMIDDYFRYAVLDGNYPHYSNWQANILCGVSNLGTTSTIEDVESRTRSRTLYLFQTSDFDRSCLLLSRLFPGIFSNISYTRQNVSNRDQAIPSGLRDKFYEYSKLDLDLLRLAKAQEAHLSEELFPSERDYSESLSLLHSRNRRLANIETFRSSAKRILAACASFIK